MTINTNFFSKSEIILISFFTSNECDAVFLKLVFFSMYKLLRKL